MTSIAQSSLDLDARPSRNVVRTSEVARGDRGPWLLNALVFTCFFPYPAIAIGNNTGLQISHVLSLGAIALLIARPPSRSFYVFVLLALPRCLSAFINVLRPETLEPMILPKELLSLTFAISPLFPSIWLARPSAFRSAVIVSAVAILIHTAIGFHQVYAFSMDEFPFLFMYQNPSFKSMESWAFEYATYIKRPCGYFPEPSAMASSIGPWLVVIMGALADTKSRLTRGQRRLASASLVCGLTLLTLSRSGLAPLTILAVAIVAMGRAPALLKNAGPWTIVSGLVLSCGLVLAMVVVLIRITDNLDARIESSWGLRSMSIVAGLTANTEAVDLVFGVGPGQSAAIIRKMLAGVYIEKTQEDMALWSLTVGYYMESGLLGALAMFTVAAMVARAIARSSAKVLGAVALAIWTIGVTITTSYPHLSAIWLFLGVLLEWDRIFAPPTNGNGNA